MQQQREIYRDIDITQLTQDAAREPDKTLEFMTLERFRAFLSRRRTKNFVAALSIRLGKTSKELIYIDQPSNHLFVNPSILFFFNIMECPFFAVETAHMFQTAMGEVEKKIETESPTLN